MSSIKTYLRKIKYNFTYLFKSKLELPTDFRLFNRRDTNYQQFIYKHCRPDKNTNLDLGRGLKIFGKISDEYVINSDIFSNFNFSNKKLKPAYFDIADVKVPYEASRLQYLQKANSGIIDVNNFPSIYWNSPMDVAIRNVNLIFHLLSCENNYQTAEILGNNKELLTSYISQHYEFITDNLENTGNVVGNHYLIELTSILLTIATFEFNGDQDEWKFYINELTSELNNQFYEDGTNFEGSTHYAAFVTEALIVCKLAIQEIDNNSLVLKKIDEIIKSNKILLSKLMNNGELSQIGDNDSGRLFYFAFDEDAPLKMSWLLELIEILYKETNFKKIEEKFQYEINSKLPPLDNFQQVTHKTIKVFTKDYQYYCFSDFGIFIWRNDDEYFSIRCGPIGQNGIGGHSHYDQLSIECFTNNTWIARDPGTGTYTDDIKTRNQFRSLQYHWGPKAKIHFPQEDEFDCFKLNHMSDGEVLKFNKNNFLGHANFNGKKIIRKITINDGSVIIQDFSGDVELEEYNSWGEGRNGVRVKFSNGYKRIS